MTNLNHLEEHLAAETEEIPLDVLGSLVSRFRTATKELEQAELSLKRAKENYNQLSQTDIPQFVLQYGVSGVPLSTGEMLTIKQQVSTSLTDIDAFTEFLTDRGDDDIVKTTMALGKLPSEVIDKIKRLLMTNFDLSAEISRTIHPQTLKKYIREICGIGLESPEERLGDRFVPLQELPSSVSVYTYYETTIKKK